MKYKSLSLLIILFFQFSSNQSFAFGQKVLQFLGAETPSGQSDSTDSSNSMMRGIAAAAVSGVGLKAGNNMCYRGVKYIIAEGLGVDIGCFRSHMPSGSGKLAGQDLLKIGFENDMSSCTTPGAVRVYDGVGTPSGFRSTLGDIHGHAEVVGEDGKFYSFYGSAAPVDMSMPPPGRRPLIGCYVPDPAKVQAGPLRACPKSTGPAGSGEYEQQRGAQ